jgi:glycosyltransferase involved in cell wall biosynthesis
MQFSIVIPAKNEEANIGRCLDSIGQLAWDNSQYEVIVVDNGSTDKTVDIARQKGAPVHVKPGLTISGLRNFGASRASGTILAFIDADCTVTPGWLAAASRYLDETENIVAFGSPVIVPEGGTWVQKAWFNVRGKPGQIINVNWLESANLFIKRSAFHAVNGFDVSLITCEDYDLTQRLKTVGRLVSDYRVKATHYREPATIKEFLKKELWRGRSNYSGILTHRVDKNEIPSLILPVIYMILFIAFLAASIVYVSGISHNHLPYLVVLILLWQFPIMLVSYKKNKSSEMLTALQLLVLFNVYFLARGLTLLRRD